ncbi:structural protein [Cellulophaga phage phi12a:1]|uniref:Structural protein n=1 Tax=Cellulophaga phage phi12a:1 TaxID=1327987 RepID=S0A343_9VIRU|nr:structural protein [Cellulophaga phage phi12a:1]AGO48872.1 structural protein [Cellulophaga phage phi12a:1]AGO49233.1 structural protein [Cellulophaga phage phi18:4]AGO49407.1 structural protein [Cellulophaga phage phi48:1]
MKIVGIITKYIAFAIKYAGIVLVVVEILAFAQTKLEQFNTKTVKDESDVNKA